MKIIWSDFASNTLKDIYTYFKECANKEIALKIKNDIFFATRQLSKHPDSGQIELTLQQLDEGH